MLVPAVVAGGIAPKWNPQLVPSLITNLNCLRLRAPACQPYDRACRPSTAQGRSPAYAPPGARRKDRARDDVGAPGLPPWRRGLLLGPQWSLWRCPQLAPAFPPPFLASAPPRVRGGTAWAGMPPPWSACRCNHPHHGAQPMATLELADVRKKRCTLSYTLFTVVDLRKERLAGVAGPAITGGLGRSRAPACPQDEAERGTDWGVGDDTGSNSSILILESEPISTRATLCIAHSPTVSCAAHAVPRAKQWRMSFTNL